MSGQFPTITKRQYEISRESDTFSQLEKIKITGQFIGIYDRLVLRVWNSNTLVTQVRLRWKALMLSGDLVTNEALLDVTADRLENTLTVSPGICWLHSVSVIDLAGRAKRGQTFATVRVLDTRSDLEMVQLVSNYVQAVFFPTWPHTPLISSTEGPGFLRTIVPADPAAGAEFSQTVPTNATWRVLSIVWSLITDATVATRRTNVVFRTENGGFFGRIPSTLSHAASLTRSYEWFELVAFQTVFDAIIVNGFPPNILFREAGDIGSVTTNIQAGDQIFNIQIFVEEWIDVGA